MSPPVFFASVFLRAAARLLAVARCGSLGPAPARFAFLWAFDIRDVTANATCSFATAASNIQTLDRRLAAERPRSFATAAGGAVTDVEPFALAGDFVVRGRRHVRPAVGVTKPACALRVAAVRARTHNLLLQSPRHSSRIVTLYAASGNVAKCGVIKITREACGDGSL